MLAKHFNAASATPNPTILNLEEMLGGVQLLLLLGIGIFLMLDIQHLAIIAAQVNVAFVGMRVFYLLIQRVSIFSRPSIWLLLLSLFIANILSFAHARFIYINLAASVIYALSLLKINKKDCLQLLSIISITLALTILHTLARGCICPNEDLWTIWYGTFITLGFWLLIKKNSTVLTKHLEKTVLILLFFYAFVLAQLPAKHTHLIDPFHIFNYSLHYDYSISTFYIAIYAALAMPIAIYFAFRKTKLLRLSLIIISLLLANFVLLSSWRPIWLGLIVGSLFTLILVEKRTKLLLIFAMLLVQIAMFSTNFYQYGDRLVELVQKIKTEERTVIWREAWTMQTTSSDQEWVIGHGLGSFITDFESFSSFHRERHLNYRSPHNIFLDVLYASGILGVLLISYLCYFLYFSFIKILRYNKESRTLACTMLVILTTALVANGLNHGFFTRINLFPLAFISAVLIALLHNKTNNTHSS